MKTISLIGVSGSIGRQVLSVVRRHKDKLRIGSIVANTSADALVLAASEFAPDYCALVDERAAVSVKERLPKGVAFGCGERAAIDAVAYGDICVVAATGFAGLKYTLEAIRLKKDVALANKETLVCAGRLVMGLVERAGVDLVPIDSEHSALWQALSFKKDTPFKKLIITASGGPFYSYTKEQLAFVTPKDALKHPNWSMGAKITIDSATLLNKGFEVIEAHHLYGAPLEKIHTLVQPESIVHSMVEFEDGSILAQLSYPTMEVPISLALSYPNRWDCELKSLDFEALGALRFLPLDRKKFPCYDLALTALEEGDNYPCALNGAGEVAVHAFLNGELPFLGIANVIEKTLEKTVRQKADGYEVLSETDARAREIAREIIAGR